MRTEDLIKSLAQDTRAVSRHSVERRIALGLIAGAGVTAALMVGEMGLRADLPQALVGFSFWMKWSYTATIAVVAIAAVAHIARPDADRARWLWLLAIPPLIIAAMAVMELASTPVDGWMPLWLGHSWKQCSASVLSLSLPIFAGLLWSFRRLAPTNLGRAGAIAGLAAGSTGAVIYSLHCPEVSAAFLITWYSLGIAAASGLGALVGPRLMRW
ncbi:MAG: DUF1109 domain-containing protein [Sphingomonas sp.]|nr:DUF1109 domain-containing protein [Sphingomonas sp.]